MTEATKSIKQLKKATHLVNRTFRKNGPKSYKKGQGALLKVLHVEGGSACSKKLIDRLSCDRASLKAVVRKAKRNGFVTMEEGKESRGYRVCLTELGKKVAEKRCAANTEVAEKLMSCLTEEEVAQLNTITEKLILSAKDMGAHGKRKNTKACRRRKGEKRKYK